MHSLLGCPPQLETVEVPTSRLDSLAPSSSVPLGRSAPTSLASAGAPSRLTPLENCIASTSIFVLPSYKEPTVDALASTTDEGRVWLR